MNWCSQALRAWLFVQFSADLNRCCSLTLACAYTPFTSSTWHFPRGARDRGVCRLLLCKYFIQTFHRLPKVLKAMQNLPKPSKAIANLPKPFKTIQNQKIDESLGLGAPGIAKFFPSTACSTIAVVLFVLRFSRAARVSIGGPTPRDP